MQSFFGGRMRVGGKVIYPLLRKCRGFLCALAAFSVCRVVAKTQGTLSVNRSGTLVKRSTTLSQTFPRE